MRAIRPLISLIVAAIPLSFTTPLVAEDKNIQILPASDVSIDDFLWTHRPVVVFADSENDPRFRAQIANMEALPAEVLDRDIVVLTDTDRANPSALREQLRPNGFMFVLIGKDGDVKLRKPSPWDMREISRVIDKMPMRQQEMRTSGRLVR